MRKRECFLGFQGDFLGDVLEFYGDILFKGDFLIIEPTRKGILMRIALWSSNVAS